MSHSSLREYQASAHYAAIEGCLELGPRAMRNSGATSNARSYMDDEDDEDGKDDFGYDCDDDDDFDDGFSYNGKFAPALPRHSRRDCNYEVERRGAANNSFSPKERRAKTWHG